jgi:multiple sugar transport system substrate-binding protein
MSSRGSADPPRSIDRRAFLRLLGAGGGAALLAACGAAPEQSGVPTAAPQATLSGPPPTAAQAAAPTAAAAGEKIPVAFWTPGGSDVFCKGFGTIAQNYEQLHPNIDIGEVQCGTGNQDDYNQVLLARIAAGDPPDSTILWTSPIALGARGALEPLDDLMVTSQYSQIENWPPGVLASCQFQGKTYGLPATAGTYGIYYNQDWFEKKGIPSGREDFPKTWAELRQLSKEFTSWNGDKLETAGFIPWHDQVELAIWSALNGAQLYDSASNRYTIDAEPNIELMQFAVDWLNEEYKGDIRKVNESASWTMYVDDQGRPPAFQEGKLAMGVQGFWAAGDMYQAEFKFEKWNAAPFPVGPRGSKSVSGYWPNWLVIPKGSKQRDEAFKYLDYMSVEGIKVWFANIPDMPANRKVSTDLIPQLTAQKRGEPFAKEITAFFRSQLDVATPMWNSPIQDFANDQIGRALEQIINKTATPKDALAEAQKACQSKLEETLKG